MNENYRKFKEDCIKNGYGYLVINMMNTEKGKCVVCGDDLKDPMFVMTRMGQYPKITCSSECHDALVDTIESIVGKFKKVRMIENGIDYKVPTRDFIEKGLKGEDLDKYPIWDEKEILDISLVKEG